MKALAKFQQDRSPAPPWAERLDAQIFTKVSRRPSRYAPGVDVEDDQLTCPSCATDIDLEHGDRIQCDCGLIMESYGNALTIWRDDMGEVLKQ